MGRDPNPLDNACCKMIECAKRASSHPVNKRKPVDPAIIRSIIDKHGTEEASLKDLRIAAISSLGFAEFFRVTELANVQPSHLIFFIVLLRFLCQEVKPIYIERQLCLYR